jgi:hypothetical protein
MSTRRVALSLAALTALATMPVLGGTPAGATGAVVSPTARGGDNGDPEGPDDEQQQQEAKPKPCPTDQWTIPLEVKGLACILLLPKTEKDDGDGGGGGLLG